MKRSALSRGFGNVLLAVASLAVAVVAIELGLRLYFYGTIAQPDYGQTLHEPNEIRGWALRPGTTGNTAKLDYNLPVTINSRGLRGPEIAHARTPGVFRILVVGDSATFGSGLGDDETIPVHLARMLAPLRVEVVNLSVAAYSTTQELLFLEEEGRKYEPDLVLLAFSSSNDIQTNFEPLQRLYQKSQRRPFASLDADGRLAIDFRHAEKEAVRRVKLESQGLVATLIQNSVLRRLVRAARDNFVDAAELDPNIFPGWPFLARFAPAAAADERTEADYEALWGTAWRVTQALIREMQAKSRSLGAEFAIFMAPAKLQGDRGAQEQFRSAFPGLTLDLGKIDREMQRFADEIGAPFVSVLAELQSAAATSSEPLFYQFQDDHMTAAGSRVVSRALAKALQVKGLLAERPVPGPGAAESKK